jgi:hypothetical protein
MTEKQDVVVTMKAMLERFEGDQGAVRLVRKRVDIERVLVMLIAIGGTVTVLALSYWAVASCLYPSYAEGITDRTLKMFQGLLMPWMTAISAVLGVLVGRRIPSEPIDKAE